MTMDRQPPCFSAAMGAMGAMGASRRRADKLMPPSSRFWNRAGPIAA